MASSIRPALNGRSALSQRLAQEILRQIRDEQMSEGDRLPTVKEYAAQFGIATPTVREALGRLEVMGVVSIRHGSGSYVRALPNRMFFVNPEVGSINPQTVLDLLEARSVIEPFLAELAARRASASDLAEIAETLTAAQQAINKDDNALLQTNLTFHLLVARIASNDVLYQVMSSMAELYQSEQEALIYLFNNRSEDHREHLAIARAISDHDAHKARALMTEHLQTVRNTIQSRWPEEEAPATASSGSLALVAARK